MAQGVIQEGADTCNRGQLPKVVPGWADCCSQYVSSQKELQSQHQPTGEPPEDRQGSNECFVPNQCRDRRDYGLHPPVTIATTAANSLQVAITPEMFLTISSITTFCALRLLVTPSQCSAPDGFVLLQSGLEVTRPRQSATQCRSLLWVLSVG